METLPERAVHVSVIGAGAAEPRIWKAAYEVGRLVAERGGIIVCGGLGGVMEAACRGAYDAGGRSVAILPGAEQTRANPWATAVVVTNLGHARNVLVVQSGEAVIALPGETGTMSEVAIALKIGKPVIGLGAWDTIHGVEPADDAEAAVARAFKRAGEHR